MFRWLITALAVCLTGFSPVRAADGAVVSNVNGRYDDIRDALIAAIEGRGLVISYTAHVADMLQRTGKDIGASKPIFDKAETFEFCSANVSRKMMEAKPSNIVNCPFSVAIYSLPGDPGKVYLAYRRPLPGLAEVAKLLGGIVADVKP